MGPRRLFDHSRIMIERSKTKSLTNNAPILQIKPTLPPPANGIDLLQVEIRVLIPNGDAYPPHGVLGIRPFYIGKTPRESPMGVNPQKGLTKSDKHAMCRIPLGVKSSN